MRILRCRTAHGSQAGRGKHLADANPVDTKHNGNLADVHQDGLAATVFEGSRGRTRGQRITGGLFVAAGINHFLVPRAYRSIVPPGFGDPERVVAISGVAEIAGGIGMLMPRTRRIAGFGLIALLLAVFPANLHMALNPDSFRRIPRWALYARLPLQPLMILGVWRTTRGRRDDSVE